MKKAWIYEWPESSLSTDWKPLEEFSAIQQVDLVTKLFEVTEHRARLYLYRPTGEVIAAPLPDEVLRAGLVGPRLSALIAYQKGACHMTYRVLETFLADVLHLPLSTGQLAKVVRKASVALAFSYAQLQAVLSGQVLLNVDETGHPENGQRLWTWGFHAPGPQGFTLFHIDPSRSSDVLKEFMGESFQGIVGCDYHSAYRKFLHDIGAAMQFCWSHLIRDVKYLARKLGSLHQRFVPWFGRRECQDHALGYLRGLLLGQGRKSIEPMALVFGGTSAEYPRHASNSGSLWRGNASSPSRRGRLKPCNAKFRRYSTKSSSPQQLRRPRGRWA